LKDGFLNEMSSKIMLGRLSSIYNLVSYPGEETITAIRPLLSNNESVQMNRSGPSAEEITIYPVRQAAYLALRLLGVDVRRPDQYNREALPWGFEQGFESPVFFPYGNWKNLDPAW
jgi:hypothetical protein